MIGIVATATGCSNSDAGKFAGPVTGLVIPSHTNCLNVGPDGGGNYGGSNDKRLGNGVVCFGRSVGSPLQCTRVESHTPGHQVAGELQFHVDNTARLPSADCALIETPAT